MLTEPERALICPFNFTPDLQITADFNITGQAGFFADHRRLAGFKRRQRTLFLFTAC